MTTQEIPKLEVQVRERLGSRYAARLRSEGKLPAVIYGHKQDPQPVVVDYRAFTDIINHSAHLIEVSLDGKAEPCLIKDVQWDHLGVKLVHIDLERVNLDEQVQVEVELELVGEPKALQEAGNVLDQSLTSVEVACRADAIPEIIKHDISDLQAGEAVTVGDLKLPAGVQAVPEADVVVAHIQIMQEQPEEEVAEGDEPEVIGRAEGEGEEAE